MCGCGGGRQRHGYESANRGQPGAVAAGALLRHRGARSERHALQLRGAGSAELEGTTRAFSKATRDRFEPALRRIAEETARTFRTSAVLHYDELTDPVVNDPDVAALVRQAACNVVAENAPIDMPPLCGGEDFAFFMGKRPGAIALLGVRNEACGAVWSQHSDKYCVDEEMLLRGAMLYAQTALDFNAEAK